MIFSCVLHAGQIPIWWRWAYWVSPLTYGYNSVAVNEMLAPRWMYKLVCFLVSFLIPWRKYFHVANLIPSQASDNVTRLGVAVLRNFEVFPEKEWYWIGIAALLGIAVLFNVLLTFSLMYLNRKFYHTFNIYDRFSRNV